MADGSENAWTCPKDGAVMKQVGRRPGAWRCPTCNAIFMDTEAMRRGRHPWWQSVLTSVLMSVVATAVARRLQGQLRKTARK